MVWDRVKMGVIAEQHYGTGCKHFYLHDEGLSVGIMVIITGLRRLREDAPLLEVQYLPMYECVTLSLIHCP